MYPEPSVLTLSLTEMLSFTICARSAGPKLMTLCDAPSTGTYCCAPTSESALTVADDASSDLSAAATIACNPASVKSRVDAKPDRPPRYVVTLTLRSYCTRFVVIVEFAQRVPDRSPPLRSTS